MSGPVDEEKELARNRKTLVLLVGGALSLLVPLLGVAYMHWRDIRAAGPAVAPSAAVFEHRGADGSGSEVRPAATPAPDVPANLAQVPVLPPRQSSPAPVQAAPANNNIDPGGSLGYVRASSDFQSQPQQAAAASPAPQQQAPKPAAAPPRQVQRPAAQASVGSLAAKKAKPAPKPFMMPHLRSGGFGGGQPMGGMQGGMGGMQGGMGGGMQGGMGGGMQGGMGGTQGGGMPAGVNPAQAMAAMQQMQGQGAGAGGAPNMGAMMQQMQQQGAGAGAGGVPNMGAMMQQMQNMQGQGGAGAGQPNMNQMMQQMQQMQGQQQPQQQ